MITIEDVVRWADADMAYLARFERTLDQAVRNAVRDQRFQWTTGNSGKFFSSDFDAVRAEFARLWGERA